MYDPGYPEKEEGQRERFHLVSKVLSLRSTTWACWCCSYPIIGLGVAEQTPGIDQTPQQSFLLEGVGFDLVSYFPQEYSQLQLCFLKCLVDESKKRLWPSIISWGKPITRMKVLDLVTAQYESRWKKVPFKCLGMLWITVKAIQVTFFPPQSQYKHSFWCLNFSCFSSNCKKCHFLFNWRRNWDT